jgi:hypothetical protein
MKHFTIVFGLVLVASSAATQLPGLSACVGCSVAPDGGRSEIFSLDQPVFAPGQPVSAPIDPPVDETNAQPPTPEQRKAAKRSVRADQNFRPRNRGIGICDGR